MRRIFELGGVAKAHYRSFRGCARELPQDMVLVAHVHCLPSAASTLFPWLISAGLSADRMLVISKPYSTIPRSVAALARQRLTLVAEPDPCRFRDYESLSDHLLDEGFATAKARLGGATRLMLLDDGGKLAERWRGRVGEIARETVSIQQTSSGVRLESRDEWNFPYVNVARSVAKTVFEARAIAGGITRKLVSLGECPARATFGVVGLGAIGVRIAEYLVQHKRRVIAFDTRTKACAPDGVGTCLSSAELLDHADIVIGCTGKDWMTEADLAHLYRRSHVLVSSSSRDVEFQRLLSAASTHRPDAGFGAIEVRGPGGEVQYVLNGGYPVNFDRRREWESAREIALTRLLLFAGVLQAARARATGKTEELRLDPVLQQGAVREWLRLIRSRPARFGVANADFDDVTWWEREPEEIIGCLRESGPPGLARVDPVRRGLNLLRRAQTFRRSRISLPGLK